MSYFMCPVSGKTMTSGPSDDKVYCGCGNPLPKYQGVDDGKTHLKKSVLRISREDYLNSLKTSQLC